MGKRYFNSNVRLASLIWVLESRWHIAEGRLREAVSGSQTADYLNKDLDVIGGAITQIVDILQRVSN